MERDEIKEVGMDSCGRLYVAPSVKKFPYMYREAIEVQWDSKGDFLYAPADSKGWSYFDWFRQIVDGARIQGCVLVGLREKIKWTNIPEDLKEQICRALDV